MTTDDKDKPSRTQESVARVTARDVPFTRGAGSESEPAPRGQRPAELPRDPTYEAELANVELAVLRDRDRRDDPSTKQGGRRRAGQVAGRQELGGPPESVTPESPGTRPLPDVSVNPSPEPPRSSGRSVASGTLLSVGAVDPRGKTERTLETPRMYFSQADAAGEAYFKPGKIPAVTVHQTIETETVKLSDSVDPRRAKTLPRIDRAAVLRYREGLAETDSETGFARSQEPSSFDVGEDSEVPPWNQDEYDPASLRSDLERGGQIHASLSPFRDQQESSQQEPSFDYEAGVPTRVEPLAARRLSDVPPPPPDPSTVPTQRDLPQHRIEASQPPPPPIAPPRKSSPRKSSPRAATDSAIPTSEGPRPTTASIAAEEPRSRPLWQNVAAFAVALLLALVVGWWLTSGQSSREAAPPVPSASRVELKPVEPKPALPPQAPVTPPAPEATPPPEPPAPPPPIVTEAKPALVPKPIRATAPQSPPPGTATPAAPNKPSPPKSPRETIF